MAILDGLETCFHFALVTTSAATGSNFVLNLFEPFEISKKGTPYKFHPLPPFFVDFALSSTLPRPLSPFSKPFSPDIHNAQLIHYNSSSLRSSRAPPNFPLLHHHSPARPHSPFLPIFSPAFSPNPNFQQLAPPSPSFPAPNHLQSTSPLLPSTSSAISHTPKLYFAPTSTPCRRAPLHHTVLPHPKQIAPRHFDSLHPQPPFTNTFPLSIPPTNPNNNPSSSISHPTFRVPLFTRPRPLGHNFRLSRRSGSPSHP